MAIFSFSSLPKAQRDFNVAICVSQFNEQITEKLLEECVRTLKKCEIYNIDIFYTSGAFELPFITRKLQNKNIYDGIITLGAIIKGDTPHFEYISQETTRGIMECNLRGDIPVVFGILTCNTEQQAIDRIKNAEEHAIALINQMNSVVEIEEQD
ncbi:MAG: 6,7-dimethyl-8-ribityllumazine synthase [Candidatus Gracilibacteria bacterium]|jgi:6,7-dimethyl-8-ribityllumazine synthase|nr:6,7-dimethyl-8-ribityllumazine synthase [Candidatus Gracilibacteria bacterium]